MSNRHLRLIVWKINSCASSSPHLKGKKITIYISHFFGLNDLISSLTPLSYYISGVSKIPVASTFKILLKSDYFLTTSSANILVLSPFFIFWMIVIVFQTDFAIFKLIPFNVFSKVKLYDPVSNSYHATYVLKIFPWLPFSWRIKA